ncbi:hypothetical protein [Leptospira santarosai]|uniref:hypothetical protein n=1 Tax=Leptospira santarosai TaxID=28183 RepID=UPI000518BC20|nr:hypothetical protein [Leptospira santarosai]MDI7181952.1 hypothetical protein [Leptospira santarosai]
MKKNVKLVSLIILSQLVIGMSFLKCKDKINETKSNVSGKKNENCSILKNVARIYEGENIKIILCLSMGPADLEIKLKDGVSDYLDIIKAECKGLDCSLEAEYKTSTSNTLKMKVYGEVIENGYVQIEINGKKGKFEFVD